MAVENKYTNADIVAGKKAVPLFVSCAEGFNAVAIAEVANGDSNNSVYRILKSVPAELVLMELLIDNDAFGAAGACDIGLFEAKEEGAAYAQNCIGSAVSLVAAAKRTNGANAIDPADAQKKLWELAGHTLATKQAHYDICITVTNVGATAEGTIAARAKFGEA